jgi:hypothetical protein
MTIPENSIDTRSSYERITPEYRAEQKAREACREVRAIVGNQPGI